MDQWNLLLLLSFAMLVGSYIAGTIPMAFRLSDSKSRLLALMGSGILVGTALAIIIPEGIDSLYSQPNIPVKSDNSAGHHKLSPNNHANQTNSDVSPIKTMTVGISLVAGFILMFFIDQFSIYQGAGHSHSSFDHSSAYSLTKQEEMDDDEDEDEDEQVTVFSVVDSDKDELTSPNEQESVNNSESDKQKDPNSHSVSMRMLDGDTNRSNHTHSPFNIQSKSSCQNSTITNNVGQGSFRNNSQSKYIRARKMKVTPTLGLVIHAAADGIALGAAATTPHRDVEMIIFLAIMLHKGPAAFSLVVFLLHSGLKHSTIRKHLLAFSLSAPLAGLLTFFGLSQSGKEVLRQNNATGIAMLFSAGTFLYVATVHVLPELVHNTLLTPKEMLFLVGGAFLPVFLAQTM